MQTRPHLTAGGCRFRPAWRSSPDEPAGPEGRVRLNWTGAGQRAALLEELSQNDRTGDHAIPALKPNLYAAARGSRGRRAAATAGTRGAEPPATRGRIDRPCTGTFRGGTPSDQRCLREHDLTSAQRSWQRRPGAPAQHASAQRPGRHRPRAFAPLCGSPKGPPITSASKLTTGSSPNHGSKSSRPATAYVGHSATWADVPAAPFLHPPGCRC